jgi:hypothetical protein
MLSRRLKGKWSLRRRQGFYSTLSVSFTLRRHSTPLFDWYNLHSYFIYQRRRKQKGLAKSRFLAINAKGGESISPKQKDQRTTTKKFQNFLIKVFNWYLFKLIYFKLVCLLSIGIFSKLTSQHNSNWYLLKPS